MGVGGSRFGCVSGGGAAIMATEAMAVFVGGEAFVFARLVS